MVGIEKGLENVLRYRPLAGLEGVRGVPSGADAGVSVRVDFDGRVVYYRERSDFFRGLLLLSEGCGRRGCSEETALVPELSAMVDLSRNGVNTVEYMKRFLCDLAYLGYNGCLLYMEDIYEVPEYPYFGYMRGRYSVAELRELDDFADSLGVELIPCVQTLAHLRKTMRWSYTEGMRDNDDILLVGEPAAYAFIDAMLKSLSSAFKTRRIHIGMDEAWGLGRGAYLDRNGFKPSFEIMREHLAKVREIVAKYGLKPMIWDDMLFAGTGGYYSDDGGLTAAQLAELPEDLTFVYWDYYHHDAEHYERQFSRRAGAPVAFAGGTWKWNGFVANNSKSLSASRAAFAACVKSGVKTVINTLWADDGAEAPLLSIMPGLALYGELRFGNDGDGDGAVSLASETICGASLDDFLTVERLNVLPGEDLPNVESYNHSKILLYCDVAPSLVDLHYAKPEVAAYYADMAAKIGCIARRMANEETKGLFTLYERLAAVLAKKTALGLRLRKLYEDGRIGDGVVSLSECAEVVEAFTSAFVGVWSRTCKPFGLEIVNARLGGVAARCKAEIERIEMYLAGEISRLEEFEVALLPYDGVKADEYLEARTYRDVFSASGYLHGIG